MKTKEELRERIRRDLGYPYVKVEVSNDQIDDSIDYASHKYSEWATGNANEEVFFTIPLSAGQSYYDLPEGVIEILDYSEEAGYSGGVNQLFTVENYLYQLGYIPHDLGQSYGNFISYHLALDFLSQMKRYMTNRYTYRYHKDFNQIQVIPPPSNTLTTEFVLLRTYMLRGAAHPDWTKDKYYQWLYDQSWVRKYAKELTKEKLGHVRRKFNQFDSIGNSGIKLDGEQLVQEAKEKLENLDEELEKEYVFEGHGDILIG